MLKKYLSLLLAFCMLFTSCLAVSAEDAVTEDVADAVIEEVATDEAHTALVEKMLALGLISDEIDLTDPNATISRINFVKILLPFLGYEDLVSETVEEDVFTDITKDYAGASAVKASKDLGYLTGYADGNFYPEANVEFNEVVKSLVNGLGYSVKADFYGKYPTGSLAAAREIGLLRGVEVTEKATNKNLLKLFDNALTIPVYDVVATGEHTYYQEGKDFLADRHDIYIMKAPVNATTITSLGTNSLAPEGKINIGGIILNADSSLGVEGYLGYKVDAYYHKVVGDNYGTLLYYTESEDNFALNVVSDDIRANSADFSTYKFVYYDAQIEENDTLDIEIDATVIINGKAKTMYSAADLAPAYGDVTLIDNDGDGRIETVIVFKATAYVHVNSISVLGNEISIVNNLGNGAYVLYEPDTTSHYIVYEDGEIVTSSDIVKDAILIIGKSEDNSYDVVKMSKNSVPGTVDGEDDETVSINGEYYAVGENYVTLAHAGTSKFAVMNTSRDAEGNVRYDGDGNPILTMIDVTGTFYIDYQGRVQAVKETTDESLIYGFILQADDPTDPIANKNRRLSDTWKFRILGEDGVIRTLEIPEKVNIDGITRTSEYAITVINNPTQTDGIYDPNTITVYRNGGNSGTVQGTYTPNVFRTSGGKFSERQICKFKFDTETNVVKELWFQGSDELSYDGKWQYYAGDDSEYQFYQSTWQRKFYAQSTLVFLIREKEDQCQVTKSYKTEGNSARYGMLPNPADTSKKCPNAIYFYNVDESLNVDCGVQFISSAVAQYGNNINAKTPYIVKGRIQGMNTDGLPVNGLKLVNSAGNEKNIFVSEDTPVGVIDMINKAKVGDIIVYSVDAYGAISSIRFLFAVDGDLNHYDIINQGESVALGGCINAKHTYNAETQTVSMGDPSVHAQLSLLPASGGHSLLYGVVERFPSGTNLVFSFPGNSSMDYLLRERIGNAKVAMLDLTNPSEPVIKTGLLSSAINVGDSVLMLIHNTYQQVGGEPLNIWIIKK